MDLSRYFQCRCGAAVIDEEDNLHCQAGHVAWPKHDNVIDLHPFQSLIAEPALKPLKALWLIPHSRQPVDDAWRGRGAAWVESGLQGLRVLPGWKASLRVRWPSDEGVALLCRSNGELTWLQQWVAVRARKSTVLKCYSLGTWERLTPASIRAKLVRKLLRIGLGPFEWLKKTRQQWLFRQTFTQPRWAEAFWARYGPQANGHGQETIVDLGCGWGRYAALLANQGRQIIGLDPQAHPRIWHRIPGSWFCRGTDEDLACLRSQCADGCLCVEVLQYLPDDRRVLQELHRILKPGGWLLLEVANQDNPWTRRTGRWLLPGDPVRRYYRKTALVELVESAGFQVERVWGEGMVSPVVPRLAAYVIDVLLPARWSRRLAGLVSEDRRKLWWLFATKGAA